MVTAGDQKDERSQSSTLSHAKADISQTRPLAHVWSGALESQGGWWVPPRSVNNQRLNIKIIKHDFFFKKKSLFRVEISGAAGCVLAHCEINPEIHFGVETFLISGSLAPKTERFLTCHCYGNLSNSASMRLYKWRGRLTFGPEDLWTKFHHAWASSSNTTVAVGGITSVRNGHNVLVWALPALRYVAYLVLSSQNKWSNDFKIFQTSWFIYAEALCNYVTLPGSQAEGGSSVSISLVGSLQVHRVLIMMVASKVAQKSFSEDLFESPTTTAIIEAWCSAFEAEIILGPQLQPGLKRRYNMQFHNVSSNVMLRQSAHRKWTTDPQICSNLHRS